MTTTAAEEKKTLLIIKSQAPALSDVENFLQNRDWKLFSTTSLKDALTHLIQHQPAFVMISMDHPNKKVRNLAKILTQAFPCCVILFAEKSSAQSFQALSDSKIEYLLYPTVTGPAVERMVNKYYKDKAAKQLAGIERAQNGESGNSEDQTINIKGGGTSALSLLTQLMNDDAAPGSSITEGGPGHRAQDPSFLQGGSAAKNSSATESTNPHVGHYNPQTHSKAKATGTFGGNNGVGSVLTPSYPTPETSSSGIYTPTQAGQTSYEARNRTAPTPSTNKPRPGPETSDELAALQGHSNGNTDSIILRGTIEALEKSVSKSRPGEKVQAIQESTNVACLAITSTRFSGYLVAALGKNKKIDNDFMDPIRQKLFKFLSDRGEEIDDSEKNMELQINQVPFSDWAVDCAEFLRKSVHQGDEVAMAFFPYTEVKAQFTESASDDMIAVSLSDLKSDAPVEFNLYIYLPTNKRYVLYTPQGGKLYANQKDKLGRQGFQHMHMLKQDVQDFNKYRAQNYLNSKVEEYTFRQKIKSAVSV